MRAALRAFECSGEKLRRLLACVVLLPAQGMAQGPGVDVASCDSALSQPTATALEHLASDAQFRRSTCECIASSASTALSSPGTPSPDVERAATLLSCMASTLRSMASPAIDPVVLAALARPARPPLERTDASFKPVGPVRKGCARPAFSDVAWRSKVQGTSVIDVRVARDGRVVDARVAASAGPSAAHKILDFNSMVNIMGCEFAAATQDGVPVAAWTRITYVWKLPE